MLGEDESGWDKGVLGEQVLQLLLDSKMWFLACLTLLTLKKALSHES